MKSSRRIRWAMLAGGAAASLSGATAHTIRDAGPSGPAPAFGAYLVATTAMRANDFPLAADDMLRAVAGDPRDRSLRKRAFLAAALAGRPEAARLATGLPGDAAASLMVANGPALAGNWAEAARAYATLPHDGGLCDLLRPVLVAWSLAGAGQSDAALHGLLPFVGGDRLPGLYTLHAAMIADLADEVDLAGSDYQQAQQEFPGLNLDLVRLLASYAMRHGRADAATQLVQALADGSPLVALAKDRILASLDRRQVADAREGIARAYLEVATLMLAQQQQQQEGGERSAGQDEGTDTSTLLMLRYSLAFAPTFSETRLAAADVEQSLKNDDVAVAMLEAVKPSDPLAPIARLRQAQIEVAAGHAAQAIPLYRALVAATPGQAEPWRELGEVLSDQGEYGEAIAAFDHALADIARPAGDDWAIYFDRATAQDRSHHWDAADADLHRALALSPEQPYVLNYLGYSYAEQGRDLDAAHRMLARALDQKPHDGAFLDSIGWIELKQGHVAQAIDRLQEATEATPEDPTANYHLGVAYWEAGRRQEAREQWERALILKPDPEDRPKIEARLREATSHASLEGAAPVP